MSTLTNGRTTFTAAQAFLEGRHKPERITARWMPIQIEPITHSGERITVAVAVVTELPNDCPQVVNTLDLEALIEVFGQFGEHLYGLSQSVIADLQTWLTTGKSLEDWTPPFNGVYAGRVTKTKNISVNAILNSAKVNTSIFSAKLNSKKQVDPQDRHLSRFQQEIKNIVVASREGFEARFNRSMPLYGKKGKAVISYVGTNLAINFSTLDPTLSSVAYQCATAHRKITQLLRLRDLDISHSYDKLVLGIWTPSRALKPHQKDQLDGFTSELEYAAKRSSVRFQVAHGDSTINTAAKPFARMILSDA